MSLLNFLFNLPFLNYFTLAQLVILQPSRCLINLFLHLCEAFCKLSLGLNTIFLLLVALFLPILSTEIAFCLTKVTRGGDRLWRQFLLHCCSSLAMPIIGRFTLPLLMIFQNTCRLGELTLHSLKSRNELLQVAFRVGLHHQFVVLRFVF